jgi:LPS-assembly protein
MTSRIRMLITATWLCHLLLLPPLVTSQLPTPKSATGAQTGEPVTIKAIEQEKDGSIYHLRGQVEIYYRNFVLHADQATYNQDTDDASAEGHVVLDGGYNDEHIEASRGTYNIRTEKGTFYHVIGTIGAKERSHRLLLTSSNPFAFTGKVVDKTGPDHYVVHSGTVTTCKLPRPKWQFNAHRVSIKLGGNAYLYETNFRIKGIPVIYLPFATHPTRHLARQSGFLMPSIGQSTIKGKIFGDAFYWAINRSMDARFGAEYFSKRGSSQQGEFRVRPSASSFIDLTYFGVIDKLHQGGEDVRLTGEGRFGHNFRAVADVDYLSSFLFRLVFNEIFTQAVFSEVKSQAFLSNTTNGHSSNFALQRYQNFESTRNGDVVTILHAPSFDFSSVDRKLGHSPVYWNYDAAAEGLSRSEPSVEVPSTTPGQPPTVEPAFRTAPVVGRFDLSPSVSVPLQFGGWSLRPEIGVRNTYYTQRLIPSSGVGVAANNPIERKAVEATVELRPPSIERVFKRALLGHKFKHVVESRAVYQRVAGVNDFPEILRFDYRDILSDTHEVEYGVVNRLYVKRTGTTSANCTSAGLPLAAPAVRPGTPPWETPEEPQAAPAGKRCTAGAASREIISWEIAQKYFLDPTFGGAVVPGRRNVFANTADFTAIAFLTGPRHLSPVISRFRIVPNPHVQGGWDLDYDFQTGRINASTASLNLHFGKIGLGGSDSYLQAPGELLVSNTLKSARQFHQMRMQLMYGTPGKRGFSGAGAVGYDENLRVVQYGAMQASYNWDCCGITAEYRRFSLGSVRNENQYRFTFSLANIGSLRNLRRQERLY